MKDNCPFLSRPVQAPNTTSLRVMDGQHRRAEALKAMGRAYQLTAVDARVALDVVTSMYLTMRLLYLILICMLMFMIYLGTFLVNSLPALVLFDSTVSRSLVSLSFIRSLMYI